MSCSSELQALKCSSHGAQSSASTADAPTSTLSTTSSSHADSHSLDDSRPFHHYRSDHEACLRRLLDSPLSAGQVQAGDTRDGYGVKLFEDGTLYAGDFEGGIRSGYGMQRWPDGHLYFGLWKHDKRETEGEYRFSHGDSDASGVIEDNECDVYKATQLQWTFPDRLCVTCPDRASG
jgi:hypothetical protein